MPVLAHAIPLESFTNFGDLLKYLRRRAGLSQRELSIAVGYSESQVSRLEQNQRLPDLAILSARMVPALDLDDEPAIVARLIELAQAARRGPFPSRGRDIRGYELHERLGAGSFGEVYRAVQPGIEREVAVKVLRPQLANHPEFIRRFDLEAQLVARLEHPHIVPLYDYWREPDGAYLVMRWLRGGSLRAALDAQGAWPAESAARLLDQISGALAAAHHQGVVHRDIKPENILLDEASTASHAYLSDFGIALDPSGSRGPSEGMPGSSAYLSPEQVLSQPATGRSDLYSLGLVLYEMLTGQPPFLEGERTTQRLRRLGEPLPALSERRPNLPEAIEAVIQRATAIDPAERYPDALALAAAFRAALAAAPRPEARARPVEAPNPYKGLRAFAEADAADFFGREALVEQWVARLAGQGDAPDPRSSASHRFLAVVGPSGSGKSSAVRAGLIPALRRGALPGSENWFIAEMVPGAYPWEELEAALLRIAVNPPESLLGQLRENDRGLLRAVKRCLPGDQTELLLVIDQFEELFVLLADEAVRAQFLSSLCAAVSEPHSRVRLVVTLRADFYDRPLLYGDFGELVRQGTEVMLPLNAGELARAIREPAERAGIGWETGLVTAIVADVNEQPGALPLLQYALTELFERRDALLQLTQGAYSEIGRVLGALARRAEEVYAGLAEAEQAAARQLFLRVVTLGEGSEATRRRVLRAELTALQTASETVGASKTPTVLDDVIDAFGRSRLLTFDRDPLTRGPTVEVAHEALLREWPRLREWLANSRAGLRLQRQLAAAAAEWRSAQRDPSFLLGGARLSQFENLASFSGVALTVEEWAFLKASLVERDHQRAAEAERQHRELELIRTSEAAQRTAANRLRRRAVYLTGALIVALLATGLATFLGLGARQQARQAFSRQLALQSAANLAKNDLSLALLLGIEATREEDTAEARGALLAGLQRNPRLLTTLYSHAGFVVTVAYSPDGTILATGGCGRIEPNVDGCPGEIGLWDVRDPRDPSLLGAWISGHRFPVVSLAFSPDSATLASGNGNGTLILWDVRDPRDPAQVSRPVHAHAGGVSSVAFSPDGATLASGSFDTTIRLWDVREASTPAAHDTPLSGHTGTLWGLAFSPDGAILASGSCAPGNASDDPQCYGGELHLWDVRDPQAPLQLGSPLIQDTQGVPSLAFSPDGATLATGSQDGTLRLWDVRDPAAPVQLGPPFAGHANQVRSLAFGPDGAVLAAGSCVKRTAQVNCVEGEIRLWDVRDPQAPAQLGPPLTGHTREVLSLDFSLLDGSAILASGSDDTTIRLWDLSGPWDPLQLGAPLSGHSDRVLSVAFNPAATILASGSADSTIRLWDVSDPSGPIALGPPLAGHIGVVESLAYSPAGAILASGGADNTIRIWDVSDPSGPVALGPPLAEHTGAVESLAYSPDGAILASGSADRTIRLWDMRDIRAPKRLGTPLAGHVSAVLSVAFSPDGSTLASGSADRTIRLWGVRDPRAAISLGPPLTAHTSRVTSVAFSPLDRGATLASGSFDSTLILWDASDPRAPVQLGPPLTGQTAWVLSVAFSPDGATLASASEDSTVRLWDVRDPRAPAQLGRPLIGHTDWVYGVAFRPDGTVLVSGGADSTLILWDLRLEAWQAHACGQAGRNLTPVEWRLYFGDTPYRKTCAQWPAGE